jgi:hypothetical protein
MVMDCEGGGCCVCPGKGGRVNGGLPNLGVRLRGMDVGGRGVTALARRTLHEQDRVCQVGAKGGVRFPSSLSPTKNLFLSHRSTGPRTHAPAAHKLELRELKGGKVTMPKKGGANAPLLEGDGAPEIKAGVPVSMTADQEVSPAAARSPQGRACRVTEHAEPRARGAGPARARRGGPRSEGEGKRRRERVEGGSGVLALWRPLSRRLRAVSTRTSRGTLAGDVVASLLARAACRAGRCPGANAPDFAAPGVGRADRSASEIFAGARRRPAARLWRPAPPRAAVECRSGKPQPGAAVRAPRRGTPARVDDEQNTSDDPTPLFAAPDPPDPPLHPLSRAPSHLPLPPSPPSPPLPLPLNSATSPRPPT